MEHPFAEPSSSTPQNNNHKEDLEELPSLPKVWVKRRAASVKGKRKRTTETRYAAFLVQDADGEESVSHEHQCLIQWASSLELEWVPQHLVHREAPSEVAEEPHAPPPRDSSKKQQCSRRTNKDPIPKPARVSLDRSSFELFDANSQTTTTNGGGPDNSTDSTTTTTTALNERAGSQQTDSQAEDDDDDEVQFMWTLPPSPSRRQRPPSNTPMGPPPEPFKDKPQCVNGATVDACERTRDATMQSTTKQHGSTKVMKKVVSGALLDFPPPPQYSTSTTHPLLGIPQQGKESSPLLDAASALGLNHDSLVPQDGEEVVGQDTDPKASTVNRPCRFPLVQSAYIQTLAEIAFTISNDARWRVGGSTQLMAWDRGDDLTAVLFLQRLYRPIAVPTLDSSCTCLLCRRRRCRNKQEPPQPFKTDNCCTNSEDPPPQHQKVPRKMRLAAESHSEDGETMEHDDAIRWLHLYCRLFYRRGPWFRIDDIYERYYRPKDALADAEETSEKQEQDRGTNTFASRESDSLEDKDNNDSMKNRSTRKVVPNMNLLALHLAQAEKMFRDLNQLASSGLIRSFDGEEECGRTVGLSVLTSDMRSSLLEKLGMKQARGKSNTSINNTNNNLNNSRMRTTKNQVWRQMNQQQSILVSMNNRNSKGCSKANWKGRSQQLLPVVKHVNALLLDKIALDILKLCCGISPSTMGPAGYVPSSVRKEYSGNILRQLRELVAQSGLSHTNPTLSCSSHACWRLRESPTRTLRRCCRLYLCATSGPGEMRSDDSNGWKSLLDVYSRRRDDDHSNNETLRTFPLSDKIKPPGEHTFSQVVYPGSMVRFGLASALFRGAYKPIMASNRGQTCEVFHSVASFRAWELCADLRANVDYWIELHELMRYESRQRERRLKAAQANNNVRAEPKANVSDEASHESLDFLNIQTKAGLDSLLSTFLAAFDLSPEDVLSLTIAVRRNVNHDLYQLSHIPIHTECEKILVTLAIAIIHLLQARLGTIRSDEVTRMSTKPWLRHMWWEGCLAYILWDIIPYIERLELYKLAVHALQVLLFGSTQCDLDSEGEENATSEIACHPMAIVLLSRRARGKALDRLMIDQTHLDRQHRNHSICHQEGNSKDVRAMLKKDRDTSASILSSWCRKILHAFVPTSQVSFSSIRSLARRLKQPLTTSLSSTKFCLEANELGLRLGSTDEKVEDAVDDKRYSDWTPVTDMAVANALVSDKAIDASQGPGFRCSYIGHDDSSLNVEQLAMEHYHIGRLPVCHPEKDDGANSQGGWIGWHDEGGHIRALFRILCSAPLMGINWGCSCPNNLSGSETDTVHLSPYQGAPFDLHVGFSLQSDHQHGEQKYPLPCFYHRRRQEIGEYLSELATCSPQEVCNSVHDAISSRLLYATQTDKRDPLLERDMANLRTLSLIAAGCGGRQLAVIFRCLLFDYRHYSGGLPDLLLVRAFYGSSSKKSTTLVDLSDWVGESLSKASQEEQEVLRVVTMVSDEEFLGCSKVGDSGVGGGRSAGRGNNWNRRPQQSSGTNEQVNGASLRLSAVDLPDRLELCYNGKEIVPECMMVEVKSSNDRLDGRQEDWLNILDKNGQARVCKFESSSTTQKTKK